MGGFHAARIMLLPVAPRKIYFVVDKAPENVCIVGVVSVESVKFE